jgi:signal peptidase I
MPSTLEAREHAKLDLVAGLLRCSGAVCLKAWGTSMLPSLWPGDLLTIQGATCDEVVPGDVVLVVRDNRFFVHRLVERQRSQDRFSLITRGDAMPQNDPPVAESALLGRLATIRRANRSIVPERRPSPLHSAVAWMLCRSNRFRSVTLRIHAEYLQASPTRAGHFLRSAFGAVRGVHGISSSSASHP